jgi:hypothetical protein
MERFRPDRRPGNCRVPSDAVKGLILARSLLYRLDEEAVVLKAEA